MNTISLARAAYGEATAPVRTERGIEYQVFAQITSKLSQVNINSASHFPDLVVAISENRKLWKILATDVAANSNELPQSLRAQIFYLAEFTEAHSRKVLTREATPDALIEVNTAIMRGLQPSQKVVT